MPDKEAPRARWLCIVRGAKCWMENFGAAGSYNGGTQPILGRHQEDPPLCKGLRHEGAQSWRNQEAREAGRWGEVGSQATMGADSLPGQELQGERPPAPGSPPRTPGGGTHPLTGPASQSLCPALPGLAPGPRLLQAILHARGPRPALEGPVGSAVQLRSRCFPGKQGVPLGLGEITAVGMPRRRRRKHLPSSSERTTVNDENKKGV